MFARIKEFAALGGQARAAKLTPQQRAAIAVNAAAKRWADKRKAEPAQKADAKSPPVAKQPNKPQHVMYWEDASKPHSDRYVRWVKRQKRKSWLYD
jgi:hypothetical protein